MRDRLNIVVSLIGLLWFVHLVDYINDSIHLIPFDITSYGIIPRDTSGLIGIFTAPFLHANLNHLISNTVPLVFLATMISIYYYNVAYRTTLIIIIISGLGVWFIGKEGIHIGASGVVFGLASFIIASGVFRLNILPIILSAIVITIYGSVIISGIFPSNPFVSWEGHLFGAIAGLIAAYTFRKHKA